MNNDSPEWSERSEGCTAPESLAPLRAAFTDAPLRSFAALAVLLAGFLLPYAVRVPWRFAWATGLLLVCAIVFYRQDAQRLLGLRAPLWQIAASLMLGAGVWWAASALILDFAGDHGLDFIPFDSIELLFAKPLFQAFNEELILRALLLGVIALGLVRIRRGGLRRGDDWLISVGAALLFSGLHWIYYNWLSEIGLRMPTLLSLFCVGFALNAFYLRTGHIFFGAAIHAGWNLVRFGGRFYMENPATGQREYVVYARTFNLLEGDPRVLAATATLALVGALLLWRGSRQARENLTQS